MVGAVIFLVRVIYKNGKNGSTNGSKSGQYVTHTEVDSKVNGCYTRINEHIGQSNEHCRIQVAACSELHRQLTAQDAKHDARYDSILGILVRLENGEQKKR